MNKVVVCIYCVIDENHFPCTFLLSPHPLLIPSYIYFQYAGMLLTDLETNIDYILGLTKKNGDRTHSWYCMVSETIQVHT